MDSREMVQKYACSTDLGGCGAGKGVSCVTRNGKATQPHRARLDQLQGRRHMPGKGLHNRIGNRPGRAEREMARAEIELSVMGKLREAVGILSSVAQLIDAAGYGGVVWLLDENGVRKAAIVPAAEVHKEGTCCCKNCPWGGNHG